MRRLSCIVLLSTVCSMLAPVAASAASFRDVPENNPAFAAVEFLKSQGILEGYPDGTFRPNQTVKRSEAVKIIVTTKLSQAEAAAFTENGFSDVAGDVWYRPYVQAAYRKLKFIDGPPGTTKFNGERPVQKVEFLKMLFLAQSIDTGAYGEYKLALSTDVKNPDEWFYPSLRYAISASMVQVGEDGMLSPARTLTRGDVAILLHRFAMYQSGRRTQALLSEEESELVNILQFIEQNQIEQAEYASARALLAARGALTMKPSVAIVQGAVKTAEAFRAIVRGYRAGVEGRLDEVISLSKEAWALGQRATELSPNLSELTARVKVIAENMAKQARGLQNK